ncbi:MAG: hypothetical protein ACI4S3_06100 [Candidatus Gastranaerophilaceae bacterium]
MNFGNIGQTLSNGFLNIGNTLKAGVQKFGNSQLPDIDSLTFEPVQTSVNNIDNLTFDPNKTTPVDIDKLTFTDMLDGKEQTKNSGKNKFANALLKGANALSSGNNYQVTPSRVDYSQFMTLSPITQKYLYGG